jgi:hypothetical protein
MKFARNYLALAAGTVIIFAAITVAFTVNYPQVRCSRLAGQDIPCPQPDHHLGLIRVAIMASGLMVAMIVYFASRVMARTVAKRGAASRP